MNRSPSDLMAALGLLKPIFDNINWIIAGILVVAVGSSYIRRNIRPTAKNDTILLAYTFSDTPVIIPSNSATTPGGLYCQYLAGGILTGKMRGVYCVELPFRSGVHLLGIPKERGAIEIDFTGGVMEPVVLEGDYPNYFSLYADNNQQQVSRFVLDPKAMQFTVDFCRNFSWEIVEDSLYFSSIDQVASFALIDQFVTEIRPAIEVASARTKNPQMTMPYAHFEGRKLHCPICSKQLALAKEWLGCPDGHGVLITASQLSDLRDIDNDEQEKDTIAADIAQSGLSPVLHENLQCPYCHSAMEPTNFAFTTVQIDVCTKCLFRWLDAGEAKRLFIS